MRIALSQNQRAGRSPSLADLSAVIANCGHTLVQTFDITQDQPSLAPGLDLVAAAGGDGTVASTARLIYGTGLPLAILPLGTANNLARSARVTQPLEALVAGWSTATPTPLDAIRVTSAQGERVIFESAGAGLVPAVIQAMHADRPADDTGPETMIGRAVDRYCRVFRSLRPQSWVIDADGVRLEEEILLLEVLNTPFIGPGLVLSAEANASDGWLSMVIVDRGNRESLHALIEARRHDRSASVTLPVVHVRSVRLCGSGALHLDDEVVSGEAHGTLEMRVEPGAVQVLV